MLCRDIMKTEVVACWIYDPIANVAARMRAHDVGFLPVCNDAGESVGTITDRDLLVRAMAERLDHDAPVHRVISLSDISEFEHPSRAGRVLRDIVSRERHSH